jgi:hypothetical protein
VLVIAVLLAITMYRALGDFGVHRSDNAAYADVSFASAPVIEFIVLSALVCLFFYWQHRRQARRVNAAGRS